MSDSPATVSTRRTIAVSEEGKLGFAKVYEDPTFELAAINAAGGVVMGPTSGGDTALSFLAAGATEVIAVDVNATQNHHVELLHLALLSLPRTAALELIGAKKANPQRRLSLYGQIAPSLSTQAQTWWDAHTAELGKGPLNAGSTEGGMALITGLMKLGLSSPRAMRNLLAATDSETQRQAFEKGVHTRRWRLGLRAALNPTTCRPLYRTFFDNIDASKFTESIREGINAAYRDVPIWENWYLHAMYEGEYRDDVMPPYLRSEPSEWGELTLYDGNLTAALNSVEAGSLRGVWLSNVGEWLPEEGFSDLLRACARAIEPEGRVVWSNFVPRENPLPPNLAGQLRIVEAPRVIDRSPIRYQRVVCSR